MFSATFTCSYKQGLNALWAHAQTANEWNSWSYVQVTQVFYTVAIKRIFKCLTHLLVLFICACARENLVIDLMALNDVYDWYKYSGLNCEEHRRYDNTEDEAIHSTRPCRLGRFVQRSSGGWKAQGK